MASTAVLVPLDEYLATSYRPDRDFLEGELHERNMGEQPHGRIQTMLASIFEVNSREWETRVSTEQRVRVNPNRYRIPDVCVLRRSDPFERVVTKAPLVCIEVVSPSDSLSELQLRVNDFAAMGVETIWVVDPETREAYTASTRGFELVNTSVLEVKDTPIRIDLAEVFARLAEDMR